MVGMAGTSSSFLAVRAQEMVRAQAGHKASLRFNAIPARTLSVSTTTTQTVGSVVMVR